MSNDSYSAPVKPDRQEWLKAKTEGLSDRLSVFHNKPMDSIDLHGLAEELHMLANDYRAVSEQAVEEHIEQQQAARGAT